MLTDFSLLIKIGMQGAENAKKVTEQIKVLEKTAIDAGKATRAIATEQGNAFAASGKAVTKAKDEIVKSQQDLASAFKTLQIRPFSEINKDIAAAKKAYSDLQASGTLSIQALYKAKSALRDKITELKNETNGWAKQIGEAKLGLAGLAATGYALIQGFAQYSEFAQRIAEVRSIAGVTTEQFEQMKTAIIGLSTVIPQTASELAAAQYDIISSGVAAGESAKAVEFAAKAAVAGVTETKVAAQVGVGVMNAYGKSVDDLGSIYDDLFAVVQYGVVTFPELSQQIGDVLPVAAASGISLKNLGGAFAQLTLNAMKPAQASTALKGAILQLTAPTDAAKEAFKAYGVEYGNFFDTIKQIKEKVGPNLEAIRKMVPDIEGANAVLMLSKNYDQLNKMLGNMVDTAGAAGAAYEILKDTPANQTKLLGNEISKVTLNLMDAVNKGLMPCVTALRTFISWLDTAPASTQALVVGLTAVIGASALWNIGLGQIVGGVAGLVLNIGALIPRLGLAVTALNMGTAAAGGFSLATGGAILVITAGAVAIVEAIRQFSLMREAMQLAASAEQELIAQTDALKSKFSEAKDFRLPDNITGKAKEDLSQLKQKLSETRAYWTTVQAQLTQAANKKTFFGAMTEEARVAATALPQATARLEETEKALRKVSSGSESAAGSVHNTIDAYSDIEKELEFITAGYADYIDAVKNAGSQEKKLAEASAREVLRAKAEQAVATIRLTVEMIASLEKAHQKESEDYKKTVATQKKAVEDLRDAKNAALKKYQDSLEKVAKTEKEWGDFTLNLQNQLSNAKWADKRITDEERLSMIYDLQAKAQLKLQEAQRLSGEDAVKNQEAIKAALSASAGYFNDSKTKVDELAKSNSKYEAAATEATDAQIQGLSNISNVAQESSDKVTSAAKAQVKTCKAEYKTLEDAFVETMKIMENAANEATKKRDFTVEANVTQAKEALSAVVDKLAEIQNKDVYVTIHQSTVENKAAGGLMGMFPRRTGYLPGHSSKDDTPAMLMRGEFVQPVHAVQKYGVSFMEAIQTGRFPVNLIPRFATGGVVGAIQELFPHYAAGGFVDRQLETKIKKAEADILKFQNMVAAAENIQGSVPGRLSRYDLSKLDISGISAAKTPDMALKNLLKMQEAVSGVKNKIGADYSGVIGAAGTQGIPDILNLLKDEMEEMTSLIQDIFDTITGLIEDFTALAEDLKGQDQEATDTFTGKKLEIDTKAKEEIQKEIDFQGSVKQNKETMTKYNREQLSAAGFSQSDIDKYFAQKKVDGDIATMPGSEQVTKEIKYTYKYNADGGMDYYLDGIKVGSTVIRGNTWYNIGYIPHSTEVKNNTTTQNSKAAGATGSYSSGGAITETKTAEFYNPAYQDLGNKNLLDSQAKQADIKAQQKSDTAIAKDELAAAKALIQENRKAGIAQLSVDADTSLADYRAGIDTLRTDLGVDYISTIADMQADVQGAIDDLADLQAEWDDELAAWEEEKKIQSTAIQGSSSSSNKKPRTVSFFNKGGIAQGEGSGDTVPAMLTPNEGVLNVRAMRVLGKERFNMLNNMDFSFLFPKAQHFASGGIVSDIGGSDGAGISDMGTINIQFGSHSVAARAPVNTTQDMLREMKKARMLTCL